ncbi:hypothetical protein S40288_11769 [Stachybotrys chartarum IBT 40288]|nr:hypothetical protein S40288_11769 [Stachybotrys chartarum IBT 40288]
MGIGFTRDRI